MRKSLIKPPYQMLFPTCFCGLLRTTPPLVTEVNWERYYPAESRPSLHYLEEPFTGVEIRKAIFVLGADKAPGPDKFNMRFYQHI